MQRRRKLDTDGQRSPSPTAGAAEGAAKGSNEAPASGKAADLQGGPALPVVANSTRQQGCDTPLINEAAAAAEVASLQERYAGMAQDFQARGLDLKFIAEMQDWFHGTKKDAPGCPWPVTYDQAPIRVHPNCARLLVLPISSCSPALGALAQRITADVIKLLPEGYKVFSNARQTYHITVFHTSHPHDPRLRALPRGAQLRSDGGGGLGGRQGSGNSLSSICSSSSEADAMEEVHHGGPNSWYLEDEEEEMKRVVSSCVPPQLQAERVLLAPSGTLLLTWCDPSGRISHLRKELRAAFPGATSKQATIIHTSLARILTPEQLPAQAVAAVAAACEAWSEKVRGRQLQANEAWWVHEQEFSTVVGKRMPMAFKH